MMHPHDQQYTLLPLEGVELAWTTNRVAPYHRFGLLWHGMVGKREARMCRWAGRTSHELAQAGLETLPPNPVKSIEKDLTYLGIGTIK